MLAADDATLAYIKAPCVRWQHTKLEHVLCVPLSFQDQPDGSKSMHCVFLCSCAKLESMVNAIKRISSSARSSHAADTVHDITMKLKKQCFRLLLPVFVHT